MARPIILGVVGDSAAGKTTITRGLVRLLGEDQVTHIAVDDYHRYDRRQRAELAITPLHPDCNYVDIMEQHLSHSRPGSRSSSRSTTSTDGTFGPPHYVEPNQFTVVEGLLGYHTQALATSIDVRVFLAPPEELRREWKVQRDCSPAGLHDRSGARRARSPRGGLRGSSSGRSGATRTSSSRSSPLGASTRITSMRSSPFAAGSSIRIWART